jgi:OPA family glycerol-3-phosphate transporter-like MFS transporter
MNWFPLGLTYAAFYMGRYNINVVKGFLGENFHLDKVQTGYILSAGFWAYALSVMFNGPLADRFGGKKAILIGATGTAITNAIIGLLFFNGWNTNIVLGMSLLYAVNCYFQSYGALSVVKINAPWFHVRERGVFGGIFGIMISSGYFLALTVGGYIFGNFPWYFVFLAPSVVIFTMLIVDSFLVTNTPKEAGFENFDTGDATGSDETPIDFAYLVKKVFTNPVIVTIAFAEFCTGLVRQGLLAYFLEFLNEVHHIKQGTALANNAGIGITIGGICGGILCGFLSDKLFQSRRPPVAFIFYIGQIFSLLALGYVTNRYLAVGLVGFSCMWIFGVHGMLSGTASMDFGGRKAAATTTGLLDGVQYIGSSVAGIGFGYIIKHYGWGVWTWSIIPFSIMGGILMLRIWHSRPQRGTAAH